MGTTIMPMPSGGPEDEGPVQFPRDPSAADISRLLEAKRPKKSMKKKIKASEGTQSPRGFKKAKPKTFGHPKNLRASGRKKKVGPFGEAYKPVAAGSKKGIRVSESNRGARMFENLVRRYTGKGMPLHEARSRARQFIEKTPPGGEHVVKKLKKQPGVDEPYAVAWAMKKRGEF